MFYTHSTHTIIIILSSVEILHIREIKYKEVTTSLYLISITIIMVIKIISEEK